MTRVKEIVYVLAMLIAVAHHPAALPAQSTKVELSGLIRDPAGLPVEGAEVRLLNMSTDSEQSAATGGDGRYHFFALLPGTYTITVTKPGFSALRRGGVALRVGDQIMLDLSLQIGDVTESVNVIAAAPLLQSSRGTVSFVVEQQKVVTLPLDGRNFIPLIYVIKHKDTKTQRSAGNDLVYK